MMSRKNELPRSFKVDSLGPYNPRKDWQAQLSCMLAYYGKQKDACGVFDPATAGVKDPAGFARNGRMVALLEEAKKGSNMLMDETDVSNDKKRVAQRMRDVSGLQSAPDFMQQDAQHAAPATAPQPQAQAAYTQEPFRR